MKTVIRLAFLVVALSSLSLAQWGTGVYVNGVELSEAQVLELTYYGIYLPVGFYWFDPQTGQFGVEGASSLGLPDEYYPYGSVTTDYGSTVIDGDFSGFISPDGSVTCGPDGGCIFSE
jgi:hypothetical protein